MITNSLFYEWPCVLIIFEGYILLIVEWVSIAAMTKLLLHLSMMIGRVRTNPHQLHLPLPQRACIARDAFSVPHQCSFWYLVFHSLDV